MSAQTGKTRLETVINMFKKNTIHKHFVFVPLSNRDMLPSLLYDCRRQEKGSNGYFNTANYPHSFLLAACYFSVFMRYYYRNICP